MAMNTTSNFGFPKPAYQDAGLTKATEFNTAMDSADSAVQTAISACIQKSLVDAKGDLIVATANDTPTRLAVGSAGTFLKVSASAATGLTWSVPGSGGDVLGPSSNSDNAIARFNGADSKTIQNSGVKINDSADISGYRGTIFDTSIANGAYQGDVITGTAGEVLGQWNAVYLTSSSSAAVWMLACGDSVATCPAQGITVAAASASSSVTILLNGIFRSDSGSSIAPGANIYLAVSASSSDGAITSTKPSGTGDQLQILGWGISNKVRYIKPNWVTVEIP